MSTYDYQPRDDYQPSGRRTAADRAAGLRALSGLTAALVLGSVVGTGVIGVELLRHTTVTTTANPTGTSAGVSSGTTSTFRGDDEGDDDGGRTTTGTTRPGQSAQSQYSTGSGLLGGGSGSPNATSGGS
jgi:hypothetical protein